MSFFRMELVHSMLCLRKPSMAEIHRVFLLFLATPRVLNVSHSALGQPLETYYITLTTSRMQDHLAMKLFDILLITLFVVGVSSLPVYPGKRLIVDPHRRSQDLPPILVDSPPSTSDAPIGHMDLQVDLPTQSDLLGGVLDGANASPVQPDVLDTSTASIDPPPTATPVFLLPNTASRLIPPLIVVSCIIFAIFLAVLVGFSWIICRYGRNAKQGEDEERIINKSISVSQASVELKPVVIEEERLPRAPSSKRFKRYASGKVPLGSGPALTGPLSKHSKRTSRKPSPLRHVYSASSFDTDEVPESSASSLYPDSVTYPCSDASSSCSVDMPPTPDLDDVAIRKELFDLDDPFACLSPCVPTGPSRSSLKVPTASAEQDISDAYDSCWIIGEYETDDEEEGDNKTIPLGMLYLWRSLNDLNVTNTDHSTNTFSSLLLGSGIVS